MAKIKMGALMTDIRGSAGGSVFAKNGGGSYMRNKVTPLNPKSSAQSEVRAMFGKITQGWSQLTQEQRDAWNAAVVNYAQTDVFGDNQTLSGKALYQQLNQNILLVRGSLITEPPVSQNVASLSDFSVSYNGATPALSLSAITSDPPTKIIVYATPALTQGTSFVDNRLRKIFDGTLTGTDVDILQSYNDRFGAIAAGSRIAVAVRVIATNGQAGPLQTVFVQYA